MKISILHISHGIVKTGGFRHEQSLLQATQEHFEAKGYKVDSQTLRAERFFKGFSQIKLLLWVFLKCKADINIVVARTALSAIMRNLFSSRKVCIVLHYDDHRDGKGLLLRIYYRFLFWILRTFSLKNVCIITVADFWVTYFKRKVNENISVLLFPNLFDTKDYLSYRTPQKQKRIHLGQYSFKNDLKALKHVALVLQSNGYTCYFTTMNKSEAGVTSAYTVVCEPYEVYLKQMAESLCTLALVKINEGWNRVAHESILVGTPVIGFNRGGLGDLLKESGSHIVESETEVLDIILNNKVNVYNEKFVEEYDISRTKHYIKPIADFVEA